MICLIIVIVLRTNSTMFKQRLINEMMLYLDYCIYLLVIDEKSVNIITNNSNQFTVVCKDLDSDCLLSYESNKIISFLTFEPNTTTSISLEETDLSSARLLEISTFLNYTLIMWNLICPGINP